MKQQAILALGVVSLVLAPHLQPRPLRIRLALGVVSLVLAPYAGASQRADDANSPGRLEDYLRDAALNNAALKASFQTWKAALESVPQAKVLPDPKFTYGYFIREVETRVGPQPDRRAGQAPEIRAAVRTRPG